MNLYEKQRTEMYWKPLNKQPKKIEELSTPHIYHIIGIIKRSNKNTFGAYPKDTWIKCLNQEINYRNKMGNRIINLFPSVKEAIKNQLKLEL